MSLFNTNSKKRGFHPDHPLFYNRYEANRHVVQEVVCPNCKMKEYIRKGGHASIAGRQSTGIPIVLDVICADCSNCGIKTAVYFNDYSGDLSEILGDLGSISKKWNLIMAEKCPPGKYIFLSGSGGNPPGSYLPKELLATKHELESQSKNEIQCSCGSIIYAQRDEGKQKIVFIYYDPGSKEWDSIIKDNLEMFCTKCEQKRCFDCCTWHKYKLKDKEKTLLKSDNEYSYVPLCSICETPLKI